MQRMSFHRADQRQRHTRAAARIFDDRSVRSEPPVVFRRFDHGERLAVLHAAGGVLAFELEQDACAVRRNRSEEHTSELQSLMRISYAVFCLKKKNKTSNMSR